MNNDLKRKLAIIFGFTFIDLLGYSLILPLLPYIAERFNAGPAQIGFLLTANALAQMIAAPVIGRLSDRWGRRPMLLISISGTILAFLLLAFSGRFWMLLISRILDGLLGGNVSLARAYITDITDDQTRSQGLGLIGAAFGLGFIIGPFTGGQLSRLGYFVPGLAAAGLSLLNLIAVIFWLPESLPAEQRMALRANPYTAFSFKRLTAALKQPCVGGLLQIGFWFNLAFTLFQVNFVLVSKERLGLDVQTTSLLLSLVGVLAVLTQAVLVGQLTRRFKERSIIFVSTLTLILCLIGWAYAPNVQVLALLLVPTAISAGLTNVLSTSLLTKAVHKEEVGGTLGLAQSQQSLAGIFAPLVGGPLIQFVGAPAVGLLGAGLMAIAALIEVRVLLKGRELHGPCGYEELPA